MYHPMYINFKNRQNQSLALEVMIIVTSGGMCLEEHEEGSSGILVTFHQGAG